MKDCMKLNEIPPAAGPAGHLSCQHLNLDDILVARAWIKQHSTASTQPFGSLLLVGKDSESPLALTQVQKGEGHKTSDDDKKADPKETEQEKVASKEAAAEARTEQEKLFDRSQIEKITRISQVEQGGRSKEVQEELELKSDEKLPAGTFEVQFKQTPYEKETKRSGRACRIHIPEGTKKDAPVMFVLPGCSSTFQNPRGYVKEVHMEEVADKAQEKFIVVTPLTEKHSIDGQSKIEAWAWNYPNSLVPNNLVKTHEQKVGYNDGDYMTGVTKLVTELTVATQDARNWGWMGGSQGAAFLHSLACTDPRFKGKMRNIYVAGGSIPDRNGEPAFTPQDGNGIRFINIDTAADTQVLPHEWKSNTFRDLAARTAGLDAVDNKNQNPDKQEVTYLRIGDQQVKVFRRLGDSDEYSVKAYVAKDNDSKFKTAKSFDQELTSQEAIDKARQASKDLRWIYKVKKLGVEADVYELPKAEHVIPGPREGSSSFQESKKYEGLFSAEIFADDLLELVRKHSK